MNIKLLMKYGPKWSNLLILTYGQLETINVIYKDFYTSYPFVPFPKLPLNLWHITKSDGFPSPRINTPEFLSTFSHNETFEGTLLFPRLSLKMPEVSELRTKAGIRNGWTPPRISWCSQYRRFETASRASTPIFCFFSIEVQLITAYAVKLEAVKTLTEVIT